MKTVKLMVGVLFSWIIAVNVCAAAIVVTDRDGWYMLPVWPLPPLRVGWAVGYNEIGPAILHTRSSGFRWVKQLDPTEWPGYDANDVSAVDRWTAWVALGGAAGQGAILHTRNGGRDWVEQQLPEGLEGEIKQVKGLNRREAWAASLGGTILHTTDGGQTWRIVEHPSIEITQVNRMDAIGYVDSRDAMNPLKSQLISNADIWLADEGGGQTRHDPWPIQRRTPLCVNLSPDTEGVG